MPSLPKSSSSTEAERLRELQLTALEGRVTAELALGHHAELVAELSTLVAEHPLRERFRALLMAALYHSGRRPDALAVFREGRRTLVQELGIEPSPECRELERAILADDPALLPPGYRPRPALGGPSTPVPRQLPSDLPGFTGRAAELGELDRLPPEPSTDAPAAAVVSIEGAAGVGKTALAVHWAHRVADRFPDGQLYVNLRGFDPHHAPMPSAEAVRGFLTALQVPAPRIPDSLQAQSALYRSLLAGRRMLVVLDNARDSEQVRPLLPGTGGCLAIVTSRSRLSGLVAAEGARPLTLDVLDTAEARDLLRRRLGAERVTAEPDAVDEIIDRCAGLPLALAVVAARVAAHPGFAMRAIAGELRQASRQLDGITDPDTSVDVRAAFACSYRTLSAEAARMFGLLGLHTGPDLTAPAAASLAGIEPARARHLLAELTRAHLITEHQPGRYAFHDLLSAYAAELTQAHDGEPVRHAAQHRMLDHYLHTAHTAALLILPRREPLDLAPTQPGVTPEHLADHDHAMSWFTAEHPVLLAALTRAPAIGLDTHAWQLAWALHNFLDRHGRWQDLATAYETGLHAATRMADRAAQARAHRGLARAHTLLGRYDEADYHLRRARELYAEVGDRTGEAHTARNLSFVLERQGRYREALDQTQHALQFYTDDGHQPGRAGALNNIGWFHTLLGDYHQSLAYCEQALSVQQEIGDTEGQASTWDSLGYAHHHLGQYPRAIACFDNAVRLCRSIGYRFYEASFLDRLGDTYHAAGQNRDARTAWQQAIAIYDDLAHPDAVAVRGKLTTAGRSVAP